MANKIEGYIGCPACKTVLFRIESKPGDRPGVFQHETVAMDSVDLPTDAKSCPEAACGEVLTRVPAPA